MDHPDAVVFDFDAAEAKESLASGNLVLRHRFAADFVASLTEVPLSGC